MDLVELFAGSRSIGKEAEKSGHNVFSIDWTPYEGVNLCCDIGEMKKEDVPFIPDVVWASPDCTTYSIAACSTHRNKDKSPKSDYAKKCDKETIYGAFILSQLKEKDRKKEFDKSVERKLRNGS